MALSRSPAADILELEGNLTALSLGIASKRPD